MKIEEEEEKTHSLDPREQSRERETTQGGGRDSMPLNRQLLRKVQELLSRVSRGLGKGNDAAEEETKMLSARWASNASASGSASMTFASSPIPSSVQRSAPIVASLSWHDWSDHIDPLRRGSGTSSLPGGAGAAYRRSFFTRTPLLPLPAVAAGGGERKKKRHSSSSDRRRSSSSSSTTTLRPKRRILPSEMPRLPQLSRRGQRQWRTLLEDEVRRFFSLLFRPPLPPPLLLILPSLLPKLTPRKNSTLSARRTSLRRSARS